MFIFKRITKKIKTQMLNKVREEIFNSNKGDRVNIIKKDGTQQIWQCIKIEKLE